MNWNIFGKSRAAEVERKLRKDEKALKAAQAFPGNGDAVIINYPDLEGVTRREVRAIRALKGEGIGWNIKFNVINDDNFAPIFSDYPSLSSSNEKDSKENGNIEESNEENSDEDVKSESHNQNTTEDQKTSVDAANTSQPRVEEEPINFIAHTPQGIEINLEYFATMDAKKPLYETTPSENEMPSNYPPANSNTNKYPNAGEFTQFITVPINHQSTESRSVVRGHHKVDEPKPVIHPKQKSPEDDSITGEIPSIDVDITKKNPPRVPSVIENSVKEIKVEGVSSGSFENLNIDNSQFIDGGKNKYIASIINVAEKCGYKVQLMKASDYNPSLNGLIFGIVYCKSKTGEAVAVREKAFTIDTGSIIDHRAKFYPILNPNGGYENCNPYAIRIGKKGKEFDEEFFKAFFFGGKLGIRDRKPTYPNDVIELNKRVALITIPYNLIDDENKQKVRDRLMNAYKMGVFDHLLTPVPGARFRYVKKTMDKDKGYEFYLTTDGVPHYFGGPYYASNPIVTIRFGADGNAYSGGEETNRVLAEVAANMQQQ